VIQIMEQQPQCARAPAAAAAAATPAQRPSRAPLLCLAHDEVDAVHEHSQPRHLTLLFSAYAVKPSLLLQQHWLACSATPLLNHEGYATRTSASGYCRN